MKGLIKLRFAIASVIAVASLIHGAPASAGTLTAATFTTNGTGYAFTGAKNTRYDWGFTTATGETLTAVKAGVPAGTTAQGEKYLSFLGPNNNTVRTVDTASTVMGPDIDIRARVSFPEWSPTVGTDDHEVIASKENEWRFYLEAGQTLILQSSNDGYATSQYDWASLPLGQISAGQPVWYRVTRTSDIGANTRTVRFHLSNDGTNWNEFRSYTLSGVGYMSNTTNPIEIGGQNSGTAGTSARSNIYALEVRNSVTGTLSSPSGCTQPGVQVCMSANDANPGSNSWISTSVNGETWTFHRDGSSSQQVSLASDLTATSVSGLPTSGRASLRYNDNMVHYAFNATAVTAGTSIKMGLSGFTNTQTPGGYTSTITSYKDVFPAATVDSATTGALVFAATSGDATVGVSVDPTFAFTVAGSGANCNGLTSTGASTANAVALGNMAAGSRKASAQSLNVATNSANGFSVNMRSTSTTSPVLVSQSDSANNIDDVVAGPLPASSVEAFGFTADDSGVAMTSGNVAAVPNASGSATVVSAASGVQNRTSCVGHFASASGQTIAGTYSVTVVYTAVPVF